ncbi:DUF6281 family protein [Streptomyces canus]|uniref:Uncharacterized protein n=1 Tax=Streptomyces canus TaxID=58343 RepID=A0AAW8FD44_9ACTN|nr:DUF6281 family protein [Streptomyces canus]MDQ0763492.1 hypothetical protein [Streptomyces canus]MDQ0908056.1 hypothetical protein [Streptomyces canus]MDQ1068023.1 hypothetical protein [Streptomyces canus]
MTTALRILAVALLAAVAGCTSGGEAASSCAGVVTFENRDYLPTEKTGFTVGERLGTATIAECDDTPGDPGVTIAEGTTGAYAVDGVDPAEAIAVGDSPGEAILMDLHR